MFNGYSLLALIPARSGSKGLLEKKEFLDLNSMKDIKFTKQTTESQNKKRNFVYKFLSSVRQKINSPVKNRKR